MSALYRLLAWMSPSYPVGAYAYSHGLEWAVERGAVRDRASLGAWIDDLLERGGLYHDAILAAAAFDAAADPTALREVAELAWASATSLERRLETTAQGWAFANIAAAAWPAPALASLASELGPERLSYPVAVGALGAAHAIPKDELLVAYVHAGAANLISAAVRLVPLGQSDGQRALAAAMPAALALARFAATSTLDDLGGAALRSDLAAMRHETQYTRLFRT